MSFTDKELSSCQINLRKFARALLRNKDYLMLDVDDLVQITLTRALAKRDLFTPGNLQVWLFTIMHNEFQNYNRKVIRNKDCNVKSSELEVQQVKDRNQQTEINMLVHDVQDAIKDLPKRHRDVLTYMILNQDSYDACAEHLHIPVGTVRSRLSRARIRVREYIS